MFKSQKRPIVVPQAEHARFAGILASLWGNADFDRPALDFQSFIKGVTFHDRGYGQLDYYPLGEVDRETWLSIQRRGILLSADDAISNVVSLLHIKRLLQNSGTAQPTDDLVALADEQIAASIGKSGLAREAFEWADKITQWCDDVAFDFSFEANVHRSPQVYARTDSQ
ncbi:MAG: DUF3891 family protein, partial [Anaerolineae bacterium]|nr:DUF3891 family protein [Anaerolineae bacterium]